VHRVSSHPQYFESKLNRDSCIEGQDSQGRKLVMFIVSGVHEDSSRRKGTSKKAAQFIEAKWFGLMSLPNTHYNVMPFMPSLRYVVILLRCCVYELLLNRCMRTGHG
jgi:hypothetical protein